MQIAARRAFLTQDHRLALLWRLLSYLFFFLVVNLVANIARVVLEGVGVPSVIARLVFTLLYISGILGLGVVVQYDRHLLHLARTVSVSAEYLVSMVVVILGILLFLLWARLRHRDLRWHSTLTEEGQLQAPEAQPGTVEQARRAGQP